MPRLQYHSNKLQIQNRSINKQLKMPYGGLWGAQAPAISQNYSKVPLSDK